MQHNTVQLGTHMPMVINFGFLELCARALRAQGQPPGRIEKGCSSMRQVRNAERLLARGGTCDVTSVGLTVGL
jgi:hypothetical protein